MTEVERLDALLTKVEGDIAKAIRESIRLLQSDYIAGQVADLIQVGRLDDALDLVDSYVRRIGDILPSIYDDIGKDAMAGLAAATGGMALALSWDVTNPRAAALVRQNRLQFVTDLIASQRESIRQALGRGMDEGLGTAEMGRVIRRAIGLAPAQETWVANYERLLRNQSPDALERDLRDRRFDGAVQVAIDRNRPLTERQVVMMVDRYRVRALMMRSDTIARTEGLRAVSQARQEALRQMLEQTNIDPSRVTRIWRATHDERTRDWHYSMDQQKRGLDEQFEDGHGNLLLWPGDPSAPPETVINCRCTVTFGIAPPA